MSEPTIAATSEIFVDPVAVPSPPPGTNPNAIDATNVATQIGGVNQSYTTTAVPANQVALLVVSGQNTQVTVGTGSASINAIGSGLIIESVQLVGAGTGAEVVPIPDAPKFIQLGDPSIPYNFEGINTQAVVSGESSQQRVTIDQAAGGQVPTTGFSYYAHSGTGPDTIAGSFFADFLRGGGGNDSLNGGDGDDLIRGGAGSDSITLGSGADTLYYTFDQIGDEDQDGIPDQDLITDFVSGVDRVTVQAGLLAEILPPGQQILFTNPVTGAQATLTSGGTPFQITDIQFIA